MNAQAAADVPSARPLSTMRLLMCRIFLRPEGLGSYVIAQNNDLSFAAHLDTP